MYVAIELGQNEITLPMRFYKQQRVEIFTWLDYRAGVRFCKSNNKDEFVSLYKELPTVIQEDTEIQIFNDDD